MLRALIVSAFLAVFCIPALGQALPAGGAGVWQVGVGFSLGPPDYTLPYIKGITGYASYDINEHSGMVVEAHLLNLSTPQYVGESSFLIGGRYGIMRNHFHPYVKVLIGIGLFQPTKNFRPPTGTSGYEAFAAGVGLEYKLSEHLNLQILDFEYQAWPSFPPNALTPWVATVGVARRF